MIRYAHILWRKNEVARLFYIEDVYISIMKNYKKTLKDYIIVVQGREYNPYDFIKLLRKTKEGVSVNCDLGKF